MEYDEIEDDNVFNESSKRRRDTETHRVKAEQRKFRITRNISPTRPACAYLKFVFEKLHEIRKLDKKTSYVTIVKKLAPEWEKLPDYRKRKYIREAAEEREKDLLAKKKYEKTETFQEFLKLRPTLNDPEEIMKAKKNSSMANVPIFTKEFLEFNASRQSELKSLQKEITEIEEKNNSLSDIIDKLHASNKKFDEELNQQMTNNASLQAHLNKLREVLHSKFANLPLPKSSIVPSLDVIDDYIQLLNRIVKEEKPEHACFIDIVKGILHTIDFDKL